MCPGLMRGLCVIGHSPHVVVRKEPVRNGVARVHHGSKPDSGPAHV